MTISRVKPETLANTDAFFVKNELSVARFFVFHFGEDGPYLQIEYLSVLAFLIDGMSGQPMSERDDSYVSPCGRRVEICTSHLKLVFEYKDYQCEYFLTSIDRLKAGLIKRYEKSPKTDFEQEVLRP